MKVCETKTRFTIDLGMSSPNIDRLIITLKNKWPQQYRFSVDGLVFRRMITFTVLTQALSKTQIEFHLIRHRWRPKRDINMIQL